MNFKRLLLITLTLTPLLTGCRGLGYIGQLLIPPPPPKTVRAEFDKLRDHSVAIVIHAAPAVDYEHAGARLQLAFRIAGELREHVKGVTVVDPRDVHRYQDENIYWDEMDRTKLGKVFKVDYVLYVGLVQYSMREPGSVGLYRGRIKAEVSVYDTSLDQHRARVWRGEDISVAFPPDTPAGQPAQDDRGIREQTANIFADKLAKKFYKHKVPRNQ